MKITIAYVSVALVEEDGKVSIELAEDSEMARDLPIAGPLIAKVLPARESFPIISVAAAAAEIGKVSSTIRNTFMPPPPSVKK